MESDPGNRLKGEGKTMVKKIDSERKIKQKAPAAKKTAARPSMASKTPSGASGKQVPAALAFWSHDGQIFADLRQLAEGLAAMSDETFAYHSNQDKQDFAVWVREVIEDAWLADELAKATSRSQAAVCVADRLTSVV